MNKIISILFLLIILLSTPIYSTDVFLTSDNIINQETDIELLNSIKEKIENKINLNVDIDPQAPEPGEGTRAISSDSDVSIILAAACAGNYLEIAEYAQKSDKQIIYINTGNFDIDSEESLRRAWDDNYSNELFAGINKPGKFLNDSGISTIQPLNKFPNLESNGILSSNDGELNEYIASEVVDKINSYDSDGEKTLNSDLINYHKISPSYMAKGSSELLKNDNIESDSKYNSLSSEQILYLTSTYFGSEGIDNPKEYEKADSPIKYSLFNKNSYKIGEYMEMGKIVKEYMDENGKAPDYIIYDGAIISYYDLVYNFAIITENHTSSNNMDFDRNYDFNKYNESIIIDILPIILILFVIFIVYLIIRKIRKKRIR